ncbi:MAG: hypothetical protein GY801_39265 [bacterium]|nr:hypothetical protein [bacterium]
MKQIKFPTIQPDVIRGYCEPAVDFYKVCTTLTELNVPYKCVLGSNDLLEQESLTPETLETFETILIHNDTLLTAKQKTPIDSYREKVTYFSTPDELEQLSESPFEIEGASNITVLPRKEIAGNGTLLHLINRNYIPENNAVEEQNFTITARRDLFQQDFMQASLVSPGEERQAIDCTVKGNTVIMEIEKLNTWGIVVSHSAFARCGA